jgi:long-chain acyl-CoA synthetase
VKVAIPATNIAELVRLRASRDGERTALVDGDRRLTWAELDRRVDGLARGLSAQGLVAGNRVALSMVNSISFVEIYLAVLRAGIVAVPIYPQSAPGEIARILADSGSRLCCADTTTIGAVRGAVGGIDDAVRAGKPAVIPRIVAVDVAPLPGEVRYAGLAAEGAPVVSPLDSENLAVLLYTSGTSGVPRAAMLSHRALLANIEQASQTKPPPVDRTDVVLGVLPLCHVYGLNAVLGQVLLTGAALVLGQRFSPDETLRLVEAERVTCVPVAPPVIVAWSGLDDIGERLSGVRTLLSGAAPLASEVVRDFEARTGVAVEQGYGLTEAAPIVTSTIGTPEHKPGSSGRALPGVEVRVVDSAGNEVPADDPGEIWVRGRNLFSGYWPDGDERPDADGWLSTGDVGFLDEDGDLFLVDRLKELVIVSGFNVYPSEIEDVVAEVDGVAECAVIGVPDEHTGEAVKAYVVAAPDADRTAMASRVIDHCAARLARFKVPKEVELVDELPHSATGKVAKGRLRARQAREAMGLT